MLQPRLRSLVVLLGALTGLTALSIDMSLPSLPTLSKVFDARADRAALTLSMLYDRTALPMAVAVCGSAALAGITYFGFLASHGGGTASAGPPPPAVSQE